MSHALDSGTPPSFLENAERKLFALIAAPWLGGKMNASGFALAAVQRQNSNSVSIEAGIQTKEWLPSVLVSTSMPSVMLLSIRRLFPCLSFHRSANISPGRSPTRNMRNDKAVTIAQVEQNLGNLFRREMLRCPALSGFRYRAFASRILRQHLWLDRFVEHRIEVHADFGQNTLGVFRRHLVEVRLQRELAQIAEEVSPNRLSK